MQKLSPSQVRKPPLTPTSYEGANVEAGFLAKFLPFTFTVTLTVAIVVFDLITDWLAYRKFTQLDFKDRVQRTSNEDSETFWGMQTFYQRIPVVYLILCLASTVVALVDISRWIILFASQRKRFKEKVDGLKYKESYFEKYGGEIVLVFQCIVQDLAISCLLLAVQAAIGCSFVVPFNSAVFELSMVATCISVIWKIGLVIWNGGCLGKRKHYNQNIVLIILRIFTFLILMLALAFVTLNCLVFISKNQKYKGNILQTGLFDKIGMDRWIDEDNLGFMVMKKPGVLSEISDSGRPHNTPDILHQYEKVVRLKEVIDNQMNDNQSLQVNFSCDTLEVYKFFHPEHKIKRRHVRNCSVLFRLSFSAEQRMVVYNYIYSYINNQTGRCIASHFPQYTRMTEAEALGQLIDNSNNNSAIQTTPTPPETTTPVTDTEKSDTNSTIGSIYEPPTNRPPQWYLKFGYMPVDSEIDESTWVRCMFEMRMNTTLLPLSPCKSADR